MDINQINEIHQHQVEDFVEWLEKFKDREKEVISLIAQLKELKNQTDVKLAKIMSDSSESERLKKEAKVDRQIAEKERLQGEAFKRTRSELLVYVNEEEKRVKQEWSLIDKQRKDLDERQKENSRKEKFLAVDEDRMDKKMLQINKLIHAHNLESIIRPEEKRKELVTT